MNPTDQQIIDTMERRGGGFVRALAQCFRKADQLNQHRVKAAFWDVWAQYKAICIQELEAAARETEVVS